MNPATKTLTVILSATLLLALAGCEDKTNTITGHVNLPLELQKSLKPSAVLYIIARHPGVTAGPPLAVKRFPQPILFPVEFTLSARDAMIPDTPFEGDIALTARIAQSGSATPVNPGDIEGAAPPQVVKVGSKDTEIELAKVHP